MIAVKDNRVYTITEMELEARRADGYDIYDDDGLLIAYSKGKTIPYEEHLKALNALKEENSALRAELEAQKAELEPEPDKGKKGKAKE